MDEGQAEYYLLRLLKIVSISALLIASALLSAASALNARDAVKPAVKGPWLDKSLSPDQRADLLIEQMTLDEKDHSRPRRGGRPAARREFAGRRRLRSGNSAPGNPRFADVRWQVRRRQHRADAGVTPRRCPRRWPTPPVGICKRRTISARCWARRFATWASTFRWAEPPTSFASRAMGGTSSAWARTRS